MQWISANELDLHWPQASAFIAQGLLPSEGEIGIEQVRMLLSEGRGNLIVGHDSNNQINGAMVVQFMNMPNCRIAHVLSIGGKGVVFKLEEWAQFKAWLKRSGASRVQGLCKPAQARLWRKLGFAETYITVMQYL